MTALTASLCLHASIGDYANSTQFVDGKFRNTTPKPANVAEPGAKVMWDFFFNKPNNTEPHAPVPVHALTRAELDAAPDRSLYRLGHSTILMKLRGQWWRILVMGNAGDTSKLRDEVINFAEPVADNGYRWWYLDALSDDGRSGITIIAFIGSVFSPYYAWRRERGPTPAIEHCALNIALYQPGNSRWAMTERGRRHVQRSVNTLRIGPSKLHWENGALMINFDERCAPLPHSCFCWQPRQPTNRCSSTR